MNSSPPLSQRSLEPITVVQQQPEPEPVDEEPEDLDPLFWAWGPPADETPAQRAVREAEEEDARLVSEQIDEEIREEEHRNLRKGPVKVILVGRESSGALPRLTPQVITFFHITDILRGRLQRSLRFYKVRTRSYFLWWIVSVCSSTFTRISGVVCLASLAKRGPSLARSRSS